MTNPIDDVDQLLDMVTPEIYQRLQGVVETGRWPDGTSANEQQRQYALQMTLLYQNRHNEQAQHMTVNRQGAIEIKSKSELKMQFRHTGAEIAKLKPKD
ncbi:YeaC family protein [Celerinatantimonas sp. YJH-8]|uniref:YeaC family protein n=1 Tax=Celerinatantimonas sp. YJH-8 TaxID=3228714 RepID=UPI0038C49293